VTKRKEDDDIRRVAVREKPREDTFKVVVIVVVILLLLNFLIIVYFVHPALNPDDDDGNITEPEPEGDWVLPTEPVELETDTLWDDGGPIESPLVVPSGRTLELRGGKFTVFLEDLMFWLNPAITVERGANLVLNDTTLEVYQDPRLAASVFGPYRRPDHMIPYIARVVNLENAVDPVLNVDVSYWTNVTPIAVGVLPEGSEDMQLLEVLDPVFTKRHEWHRMEVDLSDFAGSKPWVVIWFQRYPTAPAFIGNLSVLDGGEWPKGDAFPTGHPVTDGWLVSRFTDLPSIQRADSSWFSRDGFQRSWQPLIDSRGDVTIEGSFIQAPPGMGRKAIGGIHKEIINPELARRFDQVGAHGGHLKMVEGALTITSSTLTNMPVTGLNTTVWAEGTTFQGDHDLVSLHRPSGTFRECTFITDPLAPDNPFNENGYRFLWAIGVEKPSEDGPFEILDNTFRNNEMCIDLSRASVKVRGNTFTHIAGLVLWDHMSTGVGDWNAFLASNTIEDLDNNAYFKSTVTDIEFIHPERNATEIRVFSSSPIQTWTDRPFSGDFRSHYWNQARYIVPRTLVKASGEVQRSQVVRAQITWEYNSSHFQFSPEEEQLIINLSQLYKEERPEDPSRDLEVIEIGLGATPDTYELTVRLEDVDEVTQYEPEMRFTIDGTLAVTIPLTLDMVNENMEILVHHNVSLPPGWHDINVSVWGKEYLEGGASAELPSLVRTLSHSYLVLSQVNDLEPWMPLEADTIIIPEGLTAKVDLGEPRTRPLREFHAVHLMGWNGSALVMDGSALAGQARIDFDVSPQVSLSVVNADFGYLHIGEKTPYSEHTAHPAPITLSNFSAGLLGFSTRERDISMTGLRVHENLFLRTTYDSNISISNSVFDLKYASIEMWTGNLSITDCTFSSNWSSFMQINPLTADVDVSNCTFSGTSLMVFFDNSYGLAIDNINVTGCTFTGADAVLYVGWDLYRVDSYDMDPDYVPQINGSIEDNTFSGEGSGVVLHHGTFGQLYGDNDLSDDARLYAFYITRLQVIPPDGTPFWGAYDFVPTEGMVVDWPFGTFRWVELDGELLYDVTDDITKETDPPTLDVILYSLGSYRYVRGFSQVVPNADNDEATYPVMPDMFDILRLNVSHWPPLEGWE
jgi:hypothetical protein